VKKKQHKSFDELTEAGRKEDEQKKRKLRLVKTQSHVRQDGEAPVNIDSSALTEADRKDLKRTPMIDPDSEISKKLFKHTDGKRLRLLGCAVDEDRQGYVILYPGIDGRFSNIHGGMFFRFRFTDEKLRKQIEEHLKNPESNRPQRYTQPDDREPRLFLLPGVDKILQPRPDGKRWRVLIVEGEKKACMLALLGYIVIGIGGVNNVVSRYEYEFTPDGKPTAKKDLRRKARPIQDLSLFNWKLIEAVILFDSNVLDNPNVAAARTKLNDLLVQRDGKVLAADLPHARDGSAQGIDDYLMSLKPRPSAPDDPELYRKAVDKLLATAHPLNTSLAALEQLNERYGYLSGKGVYDSEEDDTYNRTFFAQEHLADQYRMEIDGDGKFRRVYLGDEWYMWPGRRVLKGRVYAPGAAWPFLEIPNNRGEMAWFINDWQDRRPPLPATKAEQEKAKKNVERLYINGLWKWLGVTGEELDKVLGAIFWSIKHPGHVVPWVILLWSRTGGSGKTFAFSIALAAHDSAAYAFNKSAGVKEGEDSGGIYVRSPRENVIQLMPGQFLSTFNHLAGSKTGILVNEVHITEDQMAFYNTAKEYVTSGQMVFDEKWKPKHVGENKAQLFFTSNHPDALPLQPGERRYFVKHVTERKLEENPKLLNDLRVWFRDLRRAGSDIRFYAEKIYKFPNFDPDEAVMITPDALEMMDLTRPLAEHKVEELMAQPERLVNAILARENRGEIPEVFELNDLINIINEETKGTPVTERSVRLAMGVMEKDKQAVQLRKGKGDGRVEGPRLTDSAGQPMVRKLRLWCMAKNAARLNQLPDEQLWRMAPRIKGRLEGLEMARKQAEIKAKLD
jgi:hypothetical protein